MSTQKYVLGPAAVAVGPASNATGGSLGFLGWCKDTPDIDERFFTKPVHQDTTGDQMPCDEINKGKMVVVTMRLIQVDMTVLNTIRPRVLGGTKGAIAANEIGTMLNQEGLGFMLMIKNMNQGKTFYTGADPGMRLPICLLADSFKYNSDTNETVFQMTFRSMPNFNTSTLSGTVWDTNMTGFPSLD